MNIHIKVQKFEWANKPSIEKHPKKAKWNENKTRMKRIQKKKQVVRKPAAICATPVKNSS